MFSTDDLIFFVVNYSFGAIAVIIVSAVALGLFFHDILAS